MDLMLTDRYLPLFDDVDARAPIGEGLRRRLVEANRSDLDR